MRCAPYYRHAFFLACYSLLIFCAVVKYKMYEPPLLFQFGIHEDRWINSKLEVQELDSLKKCSLSHVLQVLDDLIVMGARNKGMHESLWSLCRMHCSFCILFPMRTLWFVTKEMLCFVVIADSFQKIISRLEAKQVSKVFALMKWKKNMKQVMCILLWTSNKQYNNLSSLIVNNFTFLGWHNILNE